MSKDFWRSKFNQVIIGQDLPIVEFWVKTEISNT